MSVFRLWWSLPSLLPRTEHWHLLNQILIYGGDNMTLLEIYEKVTLLVPMEQRVFFNLFEDTVNELQSLYRDFVFIKDKNATEQTNDSWHISIGADGKTYVNGILSEEYVKQEELQNNSNVAKEYTPPKSLTEDNVVLPLYHNAIVDNILFLANQGEAYKGEFIRKSRDAYLQYWNDNAKGRRIRRMRW